MDLPTYTNIWRIEKRLYKLYDFRLPMPLPISWIAVFCGITVPYVVALAAVGVPFNHTLVALYVLPPGVLTWLCTRPVLENKRLHELLGSQLRYVGEPRTWARMVPLAEKNEIHVYARVWRAFPEPAGKPALAPAVASSPGHEPDRSTAPALPAGTGRGGDRARRLWRSRPVPELVPQTARAASPRQAGPPTWAQTAPSLTASRVRARAGGPVPVRARAGQDRRDQRPAWFESEGRPGYQPGARPGQREGVPDPAGYDPAWYDPASRPAGARVAISGEGL
ncbi:MAG TPA: TcpE family conjugal transfer membrane protein, partial [Streptosporangiaceae bacterium]